MEFFSTRTMERFRCIGAECPEQCCGGWGVTYDREHYEMLKSKMKKPEERAELIRTIRVRNPDQDNRHALMVMKPDGSCPMLDDKKLCTIHGRFGEEYLANDCAVYPRIVGRVHTRIEQTGLVSCPVVARDAMLTDDGLETHPSTRAAFGRGILNREIEPSDPDNYRRAFYPVRSLLWRLAKAEAFPVASRLFFISFFADKTRGWMKPSAPDFEAQTLMQVIEALRVDQNLAQLHEQFVRVEVNVPFAMSVIRELLLLPLEKIPPRMRRLIDDVRPLYADKGAPFEEDVESMFAAYHVNQPELSPAVAKRIEQICGRFVLNFLIREWYVNQPSLFLYVMALLARYAFLRFLLLGHPLVHTHGKRDDAEALRMIDDLAVEVIYSLSRMVDHDNPLAESLVAELEKQGMTRLEHAVCLAKV